MNSDFNIGDEVYLSPEHCWGRGVNNPVGVLGVVVDRFEDGLGWWVSIDWSNGQTNSYREGDDDLLHNNPFSGKIEDMLLDIICECGTLSKEGSLPKDIVKRLLDSGLIREV